MRVVFKPASNWSIDHVIDQWANASSVPVLGKVVGLGQQGSEYRVMHVWHPTDAPIAFVYVDPVAREEM